MSISCCTPKPQLAATLKKHPQRIKEVWRVLTEITPETLLGEGRVYGGGLYKLEPKELGNAPGQRILEVIPELRVARGDAEEAKEAVSFQQVSMFDKS